MHNSLFSLPTETCSYLLSAILSVVFFCSIETEDISCFVFCFFSPMNFNFKIGFLCFQQPRECRFNAHSCQNQTGGLLTVKSYVGGDCGLKPGVTVIAIWRRMVIKGILLWNYMLLFLFLRELFMQIWQLILKRTIRVGMATAFVNQGP